MAKDLNSIFLAEFKRVRSVSGLNQKLFAEEIGVAYGTVQNIEKGDTARLPVASWPRLIRLGFNLAKVFPEASRCYSREGESAPANCLVRASDPNNATPPDPKVARDLRMAWSVIESGTGEAEVLRGTIYSHYKAIYGIEALKEQLGLDGLPDAYRKEYLAAKGGGGKVPKFSTDVDQTGTSRPEAGPGTRRRRKAS